MFINSKNVEILKRAFPHLDNSRQRPISIILKIAELNDSIEQFTHPVQIESCDNSNSHVNTEELLRSINAPYDVNSLSLYQAQQKQLQQTINLLEEQLNTCQSLQ